jgi:hypothetical protein
MASGVLTACKRIWQRPTKPAVYAIVAIVMLVFVARSCSLTGGPVSGRVIDVDTGQPIEDANVVVRWEADPPGLYAHPVCFHVEAAASARDGGYRVPLWLQLPPVILLGNDHVAEAYRQGYESVHVHTEEAKSNPDNIYMKRFHGTDAERFEFISGRVFSGMSCLGAGRSQRNLFPLRRAALSEAKSLIRNEQQQRKLQGMRLIAAEEWLAVPTNDPAESDPMGKLPIEIRKALE